MATIKSRRVTITGTAMLLCLGLVTAGSSMVSAGAATKKVPGVTATQITDRRDGAGDGYRLRGLRPGRAKAANAVFKWVNSPRRCQRSQDQVRHQGRLLRHTRQRLHRRPEHGHPDPRAARASRSSRRSVRSVRRRRTRCARCSRRRRAPAVRRVRFTATGTTRTTYPGLFGWQPSYNEESKIFAKYINATYPGASVCFLGQGDDFGDRRTWPDWSRAACSHSP